MWLHDPAQSTAGINDVVEIVAHRAMRADANGLGDGVSGQILPLYWLVTSSARSEAPRPPHRGSPITAHRNPVSRGCVPGSVHSF